MSYWDNEAAVEAAIDRAVQNRLQRSSAYRNAASAEEQADAESAIERQVVAEFEQRRTDALVARSDANALDALKRALDR